MGRLTWVDRNGDMEELPLPERLYGQMSVAPDGKQIAYQIHDDSRDYIQLFNPGQGETRRIEGPNGTAAGFPFWTPDGNLLGYNTWDRNGTFDIHVINVREGSAPRLIYRAADSEATFIEGLATDGRVLIWTNRQGVTLDAYISTNINAEEASTASSAESVPLDAWWASLEPGGNWVAGNGPNNRGLYLQAMNGGTQIHISPEYAVEMRWCFVCAQLFHLQGPAIHSTAIRMDADPTWKKPNPVFHLSNLVVNWGLSYDISPDGERAIYGRRSVQLPGDQIHVVQNWTQLLDAGSERD